MVDDTRSTVTPFVTTDWLAAHLDEPDLQVIDGSWYLPAQGRDAAAEYRTGHLPGAIFFDIDAVSDPSSGLPHMLPDETAFARAAGALGIASDKTLVVYDGAGLFSAPRVWWTLRLFGARQVFILRGGSPRWIAEGRPLVSGPSQAPAARFLAKRAAAGLVDFDGVRQALGDSATQVVDARPAARFRGEAPEPRPGLRSGHMPGSKNLPSSDIVEAGELKSPEALKQVFEQANVDLDRPVIATCGSGVSAAIMVLALETLGKTSTLYDGSWAEYGARPDLPVATGA